MQTFAITQDDLNQLTEVFTKCVSSSTVGALGTLLGESIQFHIGKTEFLDITQLNHLTPAFSDGTNMSAVYLKQSGDIDVGVLYYMPEKDGKKFAAKLLGKKRLDSFTKISMSSLSETGNILSGSFFNALANDQGCKTSADIPGFAVDSFMSILEIPAMEIGIQTQSLVACSAEFSSSGGLKLRMLMILDPQSAKKLLEKH